MKRVIDTSEVLGTVELTEGTFEVCAIACADYDEARDRLIVRLDSFLRTADFRTKERKLSADWLPKQETVAESADPDEALELARDIFHGWVRKVRQAAPLLHNGTL